MSPEPDTPSAGLIVVDFAKPLVPLTWLAMGAGAALILFSIIGRKPLDITPHLVSLMVGSGTAIILAAFGGQAVVRGKGYVFAGVAAIALGLFFFLTHRDDVLRDQVKSELELLKKSYLRGQIADLPQEKFDVDLSLYNRVVSRHLRDFKRFDFVVFKEDLVEGDGALKSRTGAIRAALALKFRKTAWPVFWVKKLSCSGSSVSRTPR